MKLLKISAFVLAAALLPLTACDDKEKADTSYGFSTGEEAVAFGLDGGSLTLAVSTTESWTSTYPDWVSVAPDSGKAGNFEVTVTVGGNYTGSKPDTPRYGVITVREASGREITVSVSQDGCWEVTMDSLSDCSDGTSVSLSGLTVVSLFPDGFIAAGETSGDTEPLALSANTANLWVLGSETVNVGDELVVSGKKYSTNSIPIIIMDSCSLLSSGNEVGTEPTDITGNIDSHNFSQWEYVKMEGIISDDLSVSFMDDITTAYISNSAVEVKGGYMAIITGYYAGTSSSRFELYVTDIEYEGEMYSATIFDEDFDWIEKFKDSLGSTNDDISGQTDHGTSRADASAYARDDGVRMSNYLIDTLHYHVYSNYSGTIYVDDPKNYMALWANPVTWYFQWNSNSARVYVISPEFYAPEGNALSVKLSFDWAFKDALTVPHLRLDIWRAGADLETATPLRSFTLSSDGLTKYTWYSESVDLTDLDFTGGVMLGMGGYNFDRSIDLGKSYLDNIKITWMGYFDE